MDENIQILIEQAARGDIDAMVMVGDCYNRGLYTEKNDQAAHKYYKMAADRGHLQAKLMVAIEFVYGLGAPEDKKTAIKYLRTAADGGVAFAQYLLACMYKTGEINDFRKEKKAMEYFEMAARQGDAKSQIELADMIVLSKKTKYSMEDMIFWLACAYLHRLNKQADEESEAAFKRLNHFIKNGLPGGNEYVEKVFEYVKNNYPKYIEDPL